MLTEITAARNTRSIEVAETRRESVPVPLLLFRRLKDQAIYEAKKTRNGLPTRMALLERAWIEQPSSKGWSGWETSFEHCCLMLREDTVTARALAILEIERAWRKALIDWARRRWQTDLERIAEMKAADNPAWSARRAIQEELPLDEEDGSGAQKE